MSSKEFQSDNPTPSTARDDRAPTPYRGRGNRRFGRKGRGAAQRSDERFRLSTNPAKEREIVNKPTDGPLSTIYKMVQPEIRHRQVTVPLRFTRLFLLIVECVNVAFLKSGRRLVQAELSQDMVTLALASISTRLILYKIRQARREAHEFLANVDAIDENLLRDINRVRQQTPRLPTPITRYIDAVGKVIVNNVTYMPTIDFANPFVTAVGPYQSKESKVTNSKRTEILTAYTQQMFPQMFQVRFEPAEVVLGSQMYTVQPAEYWTADITAQLNTLNQFSAVCSTGFKFESFTLPMLSATSVEGRTSMLVSHYPGDLRSYSSVHVDAVAMIEGAIFNFACPDVADSVPFFSIDLACVEIASTVYSPLNNYVNLWLSTPDQQ